MKRRFSAVTLPFFVCLAVGLRTPVLAQAEDPDAAEHHAGRISVLNGEVSIRHDESELSAAALNAPVFAGDRILTGAGSRGEVEFDSASAVRLAPQTEIRIADLQYHRYQIQLAGGSITYRVHRDTDAQAEIETPVVSIRPRVRGTYRITLRPDGTVEVTVRSGEADVFSPNGSEVVRSGQTMLARGSGADTEYQIAAAAPEDEFDRWNAERDAAVERSVSSRYVSPDIYGTEDLDNYGNWVYDDPYGWVWSPRVAAGWAPYREGRWVWTDYYGWTWISYDPWGWAPYHYGRWYWGPRGWLWYPGVIGPRYYWSPALVGFFGWGSPGYSFSFGFGFGFSNIGWCPLAPYEVYRPWYGRYGGRSWNNAVVVNNTNITNVYRNARLDHGVNGVTSMRANEFGRGQVNTASFVRATGADLRSAGDVRGNVPIQPGAESRRFTDRSVNARAFPVSNNNMRFFSRAQGRSSASSAVGQPAGTGRSGTSGQGPVPRGGQASSPGQGAAAERSGTPGWRRLDSGPPASGSAAAGPAQRREAAAGNSGPVQSTPGWRRLDNGIAPGASGAGNRGGPANSPAPGGSGQVTPGWRRLDNGAAPRSDAPGRNFPSGPQGAPQSPQAFPERSPQRGFGGGSSPDPGGMRQFGGERPVQINPPIVQPRSFGSGTPARSSGGFGQAWPSYRGGGGPAAAPRGGGGGAPARSGGGGGAPRGGGGGAPVRGGGGGGHRGR
jgi:hypothetical protein